MKTTIFIAITIAALGAVGVTTAIMSIATTAHAVSCVMNTKVFVCPPGSGTNPGPFVINPHFPPPGKPIGP